MEKVKNFVNKYKAELLLILATISSIILSVSKMEGSNAAICSVLILIVSIFIEVLKNGLSEAALELVAKATLLIIQEFRKKEEKPEDAIVKAVFDEKGVDADKVLTLEEVKKMLTE